MKRAAYKVQPMPTVEAVSPSVQKAMNTLLLRSFTDMLELFDLVQRTQVRSAESDSIVKANYQSVIFSIACSVFRLSILVHFPVDPERLDSVYRLLKLEGQKDCQKHYRDFVCELGNNLCGVACRILGVAGFSTGMSTPIVLENFGSNRHIRAAGPNYESHIGCFLNDDDSFGDAALFYATFSLFVNHGYEKSLLISIPAATSASETVGELEFF